MTDKYEVYKALSIEEINMKDVITENYQLMFGDCLNKESIYE